jgi:FkbM family methyltransferase
MMTALYRTVADRCADLIAARPSLEPAFVKLGARVWSAPGVGKFYRSAAHRVAERIRSAGTPYRTLNVGGVPLVLDATEFTTLALYFGGRVYESTTTGYVAATLKPGGTFVDIGANHGYFSMLAAALVGERGRVVAFEPNPSVFAQLQSHVTLNHFGARITAVQIALSHAAAPAARLFVSQQRDNSGLSSLMPAENTLKGGGLSDAHTISVRVDTYDAWCAANSLAHVDLLKIDVEGAEANVLAGMRASLAGGLVDRLIVETVWGSAAHRALCEAGYKPRVLDPVGALSNILYLRDGLAR